MKNKSKNIYPAMVMVLAGIAFPVEAQLSFTAGVNAAAGSSGNYAAVEFANFSNFGGTGGFSVGTGGSLGGGNSLTWSQRTYSFTFTYAPNYEEISTTVITSPSGGGEGGGAAIAVPAIPANELDVTVANTGISDLILNLTSINAVANGGTGYGPIAPEVVGGTENFAPGTTFSAANGTTLKAYLDSPNLFASEFTLNGTITLDAPANSTDYGDNLNSLIEFNLASTPEPSTWALMACGAGLLGVLRHRRKK